MENVILHLMYDMTLSKLPATILSLLSRITFLVDYCILGVNMNNTIIVSCLLSLIACTSQRSNVALVTTDSDKVKMCASCHNPNVKTGFEEAPALTGRPYKELVTALEKIRDYKTPQPSIRHDMSDKDIHEIAVYFSSIK
jgi:cytochrome c553